MACIASQIWPFPSTCEPLLADGSNCKTDYECDIISGCWYLTPNDAANNNLTCIPKY